ncbi:MAG: hypothetical protein L7F78_01215 [Syntrophales bacterium LBB04]|nr:hypothetical protein [Syntrophales bacterium LBB04]
MIRFSTRQTFEKYLQSRYSLRIHMFVILLVTTLSGVLFSKGLLTIGVVDFRIRYPFTIVFSYLIFFFCIKLWMNYIGAINDSKDALADSFSYSGLSMGGNVPNPLSSIKGGADPISDEGLIPGGGRFSGAGASGSFNNPQAVLAAAASPDSITGQEAAGGVGKTIGKAADALGDNSFIVAALVLLALVVTILISVVFLLYGAPTILAEAAFQGVLATSLIKKTQTISDRSWAGSIFKATWKPFAGTLAMAFLCGLVLHKFFPKAIKLADILLKN